MNREILKHFLVAYKNYTGYYPESVHVDKIYRTRENRAWCKERGIKMSGPPLGRPKALSKEEKKQALESERVRNSIEGKFGEPARCGGSPRCSDWRTRKGQAKRRFSLNRVMAKLPHTSKTAIAITFLVMNLSTYLSRVFCVFLYLFFKNRPFFEIDINKTYSIKSINN